MAKRPSKKKKRPAQVAPLRTVAQVLAAREEELLADWLDRLRATAALGHETMSRQELEEQARQILRTLVSVFSGERCTDLGAPEYAECLASLRKLSARQAEQGLTATETTAFVFSLKEALLRFLRDDMREEPALLSAEIVTMNAVIDRLATVAFETFAQTREAVVVSQSRSLLELATPALRVWDRLLLVPLIGVIDTFRVQQIMAVLLRSIVDTESEVVIIDITGVPVVDTKVAQSLVKTVAAVRMLGAQTIITGIRPEVALTLTKTEAPLHGIRTSGSLRAGVALGLRMLGIQVGAPGGRS